MHTDAQIATRAFASIPSSVPSGVVRWARRALRLLIPVVTQASVVGEESKLARFSIAVVEFPAEETVWDGYVFDEAIPCTAKAVAKHAALTKPGETYLVSRVIDGELWIVGVGRPFELAAIRHDAWFAEQMPALPHPFCFVGATVLGPCSIMIEGFSTELAFLFEGELQPPASSLSELELAFLARLRRFVFKEKLSGCLAAIPPDTFQRLVFMAVLERLILGAWFGAAGAIFGFSATKSRWSGWGTASAKWLFRRESLADVCASHLDAQSIAAQGRSSVAFHRHQLAKQKFENYIADTVRSSDVDGAVLMDSNCMPVALGAKLKPRSNRSAVSRAGSTNESINFEGKGMRHRSALNWVADSPLRMAVIVSQDRHVLLIEHAENGDLVGHSMRPHLFAA